MSNVTITLTRPDPADVLGLTGWAEIRAPFTAKDTIKDTVPSAFRRWAPKGKVWSVEPTYLATLTTALHASGFTVTTVGGSTASRTPADWIEGAYQSCTTTNQTEAMRKALLRVHHPDHGADPAIVARIVDLAEHRRRELR